MLGVTIFLVLIATLLAWMAYTKGFNLKDTAFDSLKGSLGIVPLIFVTFFIAALAQKMLPPEVVGRWIGAQSGWKGLFVGGFIGALAPGGPFVSFPLVLIMIKAGASIGTLMAFITGWALLAVNRIPIEVAVVGWNLP
jgi:uncharacterized membrane protein YraQ (UPF0718 family)